MTSFKQVLPYVLFVVGVLLISVWASRRRVEGFTDPEPKIHVLEMYHAQWCGYCKSALPEFKKLGSTQTIGGKTVKCSEIDVDEYPDKVPKDVSGYPTIRLYKPSGEVVTHSGDRSEEGFLKFLKENVK